MNGPNAVFYAIAIVAGVILAIAIYYKVSRWIFSVEQHLENQRKQIELLTKIAEKINP